MGSTIPFRVAETPLFLPHRLRDDLERSATEIVRQISSPALIDQMKRAMARQAEAERERRAKVIAAQGELQASETLAQAARTLAAEPSALQLRYLQTVTEIAAENNSTTIFPLPIDLIKPFIERAAGGSRPAGPAALPAPDPTLPQFRTAEPARHERKDTAE